MATKHVLADLFARLRAKDGRRVSVISMGGVDAAARVRAGEKCDFVVLAADAIARLEAEGLVVAGSRADIARSGIAIAVAADARTPTSRTRTPCAMPSSSEGDRILDRPSGSHLARLFENGASPRR
jgi:molybdate transport system substrate-binding protein